MRRGRISARAEQPRAPTRAETTTGAHLRAGGAACAGIRLAPASEGASPRGRSSHPRVDAAAHGLRRISARAEQPSRRRAPRGARPGSADLRAGGAAGETRMHNGLDVGASPRGRSSRRARRPPSPLPRRISARAEQPPSASQKHSHTRAQPTPPPTCEAARRAHLRAGGAAINPASKSTFLHGASPRGRSSRRRCTRRGRPSGRISARAEQPAARRNVGRDRGAHLRAGGAAAALAGNGLRVEGASPRGRSSLRRALVRQQPLRRISARAEQPRRRPTTRSSSTAHLRAGGAASGSSSGSSVGSGASPRGRSSLPRGQSPEGTARRISARAEQPSS